MTGKYHIEISNRKLHYQLDIERKVTLIKGNSATGKTTLIKMLQGYLEQGAKSGIHLKNEQNVPITVFTPVTRWERDLPELRKHIIFIDESVDFLYSPGFQKIFLSSDNYLVIISRSGCFNHLPYAIESIYELRTKKQPDGHLTKMYHLYSESILVNPSDIIITEDSNAGKEMIGQIFNCTVDAANGNIHAKLMQYLKKNTRLYIIVDGAAFGGFIAKAMNLAKIQGYTSILAPESFEYLLLMTDGYQKFVTDELAETWKYCDSSKFITWERYYTHLLNTISYEKYGFYYNKSILHPSFMTDSTLTHIKSLLEKCVVTET